jgi:DNA-binding Xre family transcriptional regulator
MQLNMHKVDIALANSGVNKTQLAEKAGISRQGFMSLLSQRELTPVSVGKIAKALNVDVAEIVEN